MNWIISELFYPDEVSTAKILTEIALEKVSEMQVSVICGPSGYENSYFTQSKNLDSRIKIYRISLPKLNKNKLFQRVLRLLLLTLKMSWKILIKVKKNDNVFMTTNPTFLLIPISLIKKIKGFKLEILIHDVFPENLVPAGLINRNSFKYRLLSKLYNLSYKSSDRIIVLGEDMKNLILKKISPRKIKIDIINNWSDNDIYPVDDFDISKYLGIDVNKKVVFGFAGNLGRVQGILEFIDLFNKANNPEAILVIFGDGALKSFIQQKIKDEKLHNIHFFGQKSRREQNSFLNACHIGVVSLVRGMKGLGVPSKTYNIMAAGKPIFYIGDSGSEIDNYVKKYGCGWSYSWDEEYKIISEIKNFTSLSLSIILEKGSKSHKASLNYTKDRMLKLF